jgi:glycosyltransferase involved in cell wall biosynthesis
MKLVRQFDQQLGKATSEIDEAEISTYLWGDVEVIFFEDERGLSIGHKRNVLKDLANGQYLAFIDSDDRIGPNYFKRILEGIDIGVDCCSLRGIITEDGVNPLVFEHSIRYNEYRTNPEGMPVRYERYPNHISCIKSSIGKQFKFPDINHGEDTDWATQIHRSGLIKTEYYIDEIIYYYDYISKK